MAGADRYERQDDHRRDARVDADRGRASVALATGNVGFPLVGRGHRRAGPMTCWRGAVQCAAAFHEYGAPVARYSQYRARSPRLARLTRRIRRGEGRILHPDRSTSSTPTIHSVGDWPPEMPRVVEFTVRQRLPGQYGMADSWLVDALDEPLAPGRCGAPGWPAQCRQRAGGGALGVPTAFHRRRCGRGSRPLSGRAP